MSRAIMMTPKTAPPSSRIGPEATPEPVVRAVPHRVRELDRARGAGGDHRRERRVHPLVRLGRDVGEPVLPDHLVAASPLAEPVRPARDPGGVDLHDPVGRVLDQRLQLRARPRERPRRAPLLGDVLQRADDAHLLASGSRTDAAWMWTVRSSVSPATGTRTSIGTAPLGEEVARIAASTSSRSSGWIAPKNMSRETQVPTEHPRMRTASLGEHGRVVPAVGHVDHLDLPAAAARDLLGRAQVLGGVEAVPPGDRRRSPPRPPRPATASMDCPIS